MVAGQKDQGEVEQTCHVGGEFTAEDIRQTPTLTVRAMRIFFKLLHRGLVMLKDLIRGSFLLKISWQPMWCAAPFTYNARTGVLNGLTFPPQGKLAPQFKDPTQRAISHQLDLTYAKSLCDWLIFGVFFCHVYLSVSQGNHLGLRQAPRAQCQTMQWWGGGEWSGVGEQTQKCLRW